MSDFDDTRWADSAFSKEYLASADHFIPDRFHLFNVMRSFFRTFFKDQPTVRVCDLGCGDGVLADQLLREGRAVEITLVDGSVEMLDAAKRRFSGRSEVQFLQETFDEILEQEAALPMFHFVVSAFAIHHLRAAQRKTLFATLLRSIEPGGYFMNIEATLPDQQELTDWYYQLWSEWITRRGQLLGLGDRYEEIPGKARQNSDNHYSPLSQHLEDLRSAGFGQVECHYRNGIFAIYSGKRP
jgi:tRNA (cmo5U34)-methyltransferase